MNISLSSLIPKILVILICAALAICTWKGLFSNYKPIYVKVGTGKLAQIIEIPQEIVKSKDCKKFRQWAASDPFVYLYQDICPWRLKPKGEIGQFIVNGVQLNIPRSYLMMDRDEPDGELTSQYIMVIYDNRKLRALKHSDDTKENRYKIFRIRIDSIKHFCEYRKKNRECNPMQIEYVSAVHALDEDYTTQCTLYEKNSKYGTDIYHWYHKLDGNKEGFIYEYYIIGDFKNPNYWSKCPNKNIEDINNAQRPIICETFFNYRKDFIINYTFNKKLLKHQLNIRNEIEKLISSFTIGVKYD